MKRIATFGLMLVFALLWMAPARAEIDLRVGGTTELPGVGLVKMTKTIDFAVTPVDSGETVSLWNIPANVTVDEITMTVDDSVTPTTTIDIGDLTDMDGYADNESVGTTGYYNTSRFCAWNYRQLVPMSFYDAAVAASQDAAEWGVEPTSDVGGGVKRVKLPVKGWVVGVVATVDAAATAGSLTADVTVGGTATGLQAVLEADATSAIGWQVPGLDAFAWGGLIGVKVTTSSDWNGTSSDAVVHVYVAGDSGDVGEAPYAYGKNYNDAAGRIVMTANGALANGKITINCICHK
jgi:hypothetical protein